MASRTTKRCPRCKQNKPAAEFNRSSRIRDGLQVHCRDCQHIYHAATYQRHRLQYLERDRLIYQQRLLTAFGITLEDYEALLAEQEGLCAICRRPMDPPCLDHDHRTQRVRGLLCRQCNLALGNFEDDLARLEAAVVYLRRRRDRTLRVVGAES